MSPPNHSSGCINTRSCVRIIGIFNFWINVWGLISSLLMLNPEYGPYLSFKARTGYVIVNSSLSIWFLYINYNLIQSTNDFKVHKINQWVITYTIILAFIVLLVIITATMVSSYQIVVISMPFIMFFWYQISVVKSFYNKQINRTLDAATGATSSARAAVAFDSNVAPPAVGVVGPSAPNQLQTTDNRLYYPLHGVYTTGPVTGPQHHAFDPTTTMYPRPEESDDPLRNFVVVDSDVQYPVQEPCHRPPTCFPPAYDMIKQ